MAEVRRLSGGSLASVGHLAAADDFLGAADQQMCRLAVDGTDRLISAVMNLYTDQVIFASSMQVHAPCPLGRRINESMPIDPRWAYPRHKAAAERLLFESAAARESSCYAWRGCTGGSGRRLLKRSRRPMGASARWPWSTSRMC